MTGNSYYSRRLSADRLKLCYDIAPPAVRRYLEAEIEYILRSIRATDSVLDLGCGYGRVLRRIAEKARFIAGIDLSLESLLLARDLPVAQMNAIAPAFRPATFDLVCCPQNGISAFHVDPRTLMESAVAVTKPGGKVQFFSYAEAFWDDRLAWFRLQAAQGLIGEIDEERTREGTIVCRDGFTATTLGEAQFAELAAGLGNVHITQLDRASVVCEITVRQKRSDAC